VSALALRDLLPRLRLQFGPDSPFVVLPTTGCRELAADLVEWQCLRGADKVQLATALMARRLAVEAETFLFVSDDELQLQGRNGRGAGRAAPCGLKKGLRCAGARPIRSSQRVSARKIRAT